MKYGPRNTALCCALFCAFAALCHGRVFERSSAVADSTKVLLSAGGTLAYESSITINGSKGELAVVGFNKSLPGLIRELGRAFNTTNIAYAGGTMGLITANADGFVLKITALKLGNNNEALVFKIFQSEADSRTASIPPSQNQMKDMPSFPGCEPLFCAKDDKSNAGLAVSLSTAEPSSIHNFYAARLSATGWSPAIPGASPPKGPGMLVYSKGFEICCVMVDSSSTDGKNRITLLHKQQGIE